MIDIFGFALPLLYLHLGTLAITAVFILLADHQAFEWVLGHKEKLNKKTIMILHYGTLVGLILMIGSGVAMAFPLKEYLVTVSAFWVKMFFVALLVVNSFFIGKLMHTAINHSYKSLALSEKIPLFISGGISGISWLGAFVAAIFMGFGTLLGLFNSVF
jgi:hypothetical protein